jgi:hypothetical protein
MRNFALKFLSRFECIGEGDFPCYTFMGNPKYVRLWPSLYVQNCSQISQNCLSHAILIVALYVVDACFQFIGQNSQILIAYQ